MPMRRSQESECGSVGADSWELADPAGKSLNDVRAIRYEIDGRVQMLLAELVRARVR